MSKDTLREAVSRVVTVVAVRVTVAAVTPAPAAAAAAAARAGYEAAEVLKYAEAVVRRWAAL